MLRQAAFYSFSDTFLKEKAGSILMFADISKLPKIW
jgi:hypothetical protein